MLYESVNEIKTYQFEIANFFRNPVNSVNFGINYHKKDKTKDNLLVFDTKIDVFNLINSENENFVQANQDLIEDAEFSRAKSKRRISQPVDAEFSRAKSKRRISQPVLETQNCLYRMLFYFSNFHYSEGIELPNEELFLLFNFIGRYYKVPIGRHFENIKYFDINFFKILYVITDDKTGFIDYVDENKVIKF